MDNNKLLYYTEKIKKEFEGNEIIFNEKCASIEIILKDRKYLYNYEGDEEKDYLDAVDNVSLYIHE